MKIDMTVKLTYPYPGAPHGGYPMEMGSVAWPLAEVTVLAVVPNPKSLAEKLVCRLVNGWWFHICLTSNYGRHEYQIVEGK